MEYAKIIKNKEKYFIHGAYTQNSTNGDTYLLILIRNEYK